MTDTLVCYSTRGPFGLLHWVPGGWFGVCAGSLPHLLYLLVVHPPFFLLVSEIVYMDSYPVQTNTLPYVSFLHSKSVYM
jgi:hypothetical protein